MNRTARVLSIAAGNEVVVSGVVAGLAADSLPFGSALVDLGERDLKDLNRSEHVFRLTAPGLAGATSTVDTNIRFAPSDRRRRSIAVLPFDVMGGDDDTVALADGLVEDVITALSYWRHFPVTARTSTSALPR